VELAGVARVRDPTLVRHIYDLHVTSAYYDATEVAQLAREIMPRDAEEFANQFPAYRENPVEETRRALAALETEQHFAQRYTEFLQLMVYGVKEVAGRVADWIDSQQSLQRQTTRPSVQPRG
jgi:Nucleotidyl transferase AbiEii toxin, Type IV TA system